MCLRVAVDDGVTRDESAGRRREAGSVGRGHHRPDGPLRHESVRAVDVRAAVSRSWCREHRSGVDRAGCAVPFGGRSRSATGTATVTRGRCVPSRDPRQPALHRQAGVEPARVRQPAPDGLGRGAPASRGTGDFSHGRASALGERDGLRRCSARSRQPTDPRWRATQLLALRAAPTRGLRAAYGLALGARPGGVPVQA